MAKLTDLYREQLGLFQAEAEKLGGVLSEAGAEEVLFGGTITVHSGRAVAMMAPVRGPSQETLLREGGIAAVLWLTPGSVQTGVKQKLRAGMYALRFQRTGEAGARLDFLSANGTVAHRARGFLMLPRGLDLEDEIKKLLKKLGKDIKVVDVEILFNGKPSKVRGSVLFWSFDLFDDP